MSDAFILQYLSLLSERVDTLVKQVNDCQLEEVRVAEIANRLDAANKKLEELVMLDPLTGIGNRRMFDGRMADKIADARRGWPLSLLMIDVDYFKQYNDNYGHLAGDHALKQVASELRGGVRQTDCLARYGGEEFVLASSVGIDGALVLADKLRRRIEYMPSCNQKITVSIGVSIFEPDDDNTVLIAKADRALYSAKSQGRNRVKAYNQ